VDEKEKEQDGEVENDHQVPTDDPRRAVIRLHCKYSSNTMTHLGPPSNLGDFTSGHPRAVIPSCDRSDAMERGEYETLATYQIKSGPDGEGQE